MKLKEISFSFSLKLLSCKVDSFVDYPWTRGELCIKDYLDCLERYIRYLIPFHLHKTRNRYQISILTKQFLHSRITASVLLDTTENFLAPQFLQIGQALNGFVIGYHKAFS